MIVDYIFIIWCSFVNFFDKSVTVEVVLTELVEVLMEASVIPHMQRVSIWRSRVCKFTAFISYTYTPVVLIVQQPFG